VQFQKRKCIEKECIEEEWKEKLQPFVHECFRRFDLDSNGSLDKTEYSYFLRYLVHEKKAFDDYCAAVFSQKVADAMAAEGIEIARDNKAEEKEFERMRKETRAEAAKVRDKLQLVTQEACERYFREQTERNGKAFNCIDANKNGLISECEIAEALLPGTARNRALMLALGFDPDGLKQLLKGGKHRASYSEHAKDDCELGEYTPSTLYPSPPHAEGQRESNNKRKCVRSHSTVQRNAIAPMCLCLGGSLKCDGNCLRGPNTDNLLVPTSVNGKPIRGRRIR
jgi:Ca2+-binding EF-hand superfamily protein